MNTSNGQKRDPSLSSDHHPSPIKALLIEDDPEDAQLLREMLAEAKETRFDVEWVDQIQAGLERLSDGGIEVILLDLSLPDSVGLDTILTVQSRATRIPIVVLTGLDDEALAMRAVSEGAQDYLVKGQVDSRLLVRSIRYAIERKRTEEELRKAKELFEKTFKSQRDAIFLLDAGIPPMILDCNPAATEIFGYTRQEMLGRTTALLHVDERALRKFQKNLYPAISARGYAHLSEFEMKRKNGPVFPTEVSVMPLEDEKGERMGWVSVVHDITEQKGGEEQLQKYANDLEKMVRERTAELANTTTFLHNVLDSSTEYAIVATNPKGTILNWNTGARNIFGYDAEEVIGKANIDILYDKSFLRVNKRKNILRAATDAKSNNADFNNLTLIRKNGESFPADLTATYLRDAQGKKIGTLGIIRDVTERKMLERQLIQSEKMAGIGTLAAGIAHEIRNPLSIINTSAYLLREQIIGKDGEAEDLLAQIQGGIKRTQTIINNLLDFSRPAVHEVECVDLKILMEQIFSLEGRALSTQNIELRSDLKDVPKMMANLDSLKHIFLNLLINAVHSMPQGGTLGIRTYQVDEKVTVEISDTGTGIARKDLPRIFDPFFTTKEPGKGTGLGLAFVHSEIERMGATIRVESKANVGSTFIVEFPLGDHGNAE